MAKKKVNTEQERNFEEELQKAIEQASKPMPATLEDMKEKLFQFLHDWDNMNVTTEHTKRVHYVLRNRITAALQATFGHRESANATKEALQIRYKSKQ